MLFRSLGSLVGFRYRSARVALIRWSLFFSAIGLCAFFGLPALWSRIPEGWRERIWQIVTLQETPKQQGAEIDTPVTPGSPRTKGDDVSPLINKPKVQQAPAPNNSLLAPSPPIPRGPVTIPSLENPLSEDASQESPIDAVPPVVLPLQRPSTKL